MLLLLVFAQKIDVYVDDFLAVYLQIINSMRKEEQVCRQKKKRERFVFHFDPVSHQRLKNERVREKEKK